MDEPGRDDPMPPYAFVPGGPWPHPTGSPLGHSAGRTDVRAQPIGPGGWRESPEFRRGVALFNGGYYWEAHEAWESLWHAHGRTGEIAELLKALIKLAASGVKVREGQARGASTHARRAADLFESARAGAGDRLLGLDLAAWAEIARRIAEHPPGEDSPPGTPVVRVFDFSIDPE